MISSTDRQQQQSPAPSAAPGLWRQVPTPEFMPGRTTEQQRKGIIYERRIHRILDRLCPPDGVLHHNPFYIHIGTGRLVSPDAVLLLPDRALVIEVKLTAHEGAMAKLMDLYCPAVESVHELRPVPVLISRRTAPGVTWPLIPVIDDILIATAPSHCLCD